MHFNPDKDIPDLSGKVILVTGGNIGLGKQTILELSKHAPEQVFLAARSESKAVTAIDEIRQLVPNASPITYLNLDLTRFDSIKRAVQQFHTMSQKLHILINNAAIMATPPGTTQEGYEIQFGTNHVGHALLIQLLLPTLEKTALSSNPAQDVRIISVASDLEATAPSPRPYNFVDLKTDMSSTKAFTRYAISKLANVHYARALSRRHPAIRSIAVHPGVVNTNLTSGLGANWPILKPFLPLLGLFLTKVSDGAKNQLWASVSPDAKSGEFYFPVGVIGKGSQQSRSSDLEGQLWSWTEQELKDQL
ncbi:hypothetical protein Neosp_015077 [[Neocosmospora] mangrovei]